MTVGTGTADDGAVTSPQSPPSGQAELDVVITDNAEAHQYEARVGAELAAIAQYRLRDDRVVFVHTEVFPRWKSKGIASRLVRAALDDVVARGLMITPLCPFVSGYLRRHPQYLPRVDEAHRHALEGTAAG
jgi:predicted GNAT family acetyltransferase